MKETITISYFKCPSPLGEDLYQRIKKSLEQSGSHGLPIEVVLRENNPYIATEAYLCDDVIIFDGSLGDEYVEINGKTIGQQYDAMLEVMKSSEHALIVSRSPVPLNVTCVWKGAYPNYIKTGESVYKETMTNDEILSWIEDMFASDNIQLPDPHKIEHEFYSKLTDEEKAKILMQKIHENIDAATNHEETPKVFISYLSRYSKYHPDTHPEQQYGYTVEDLIDYISITQGVSKNDIGYFPPGKISQELMTTQRRWEIVSSTDDFISTCSQFWILNTPGYLDSWWTLSERITLSYILADPDRNCPDIYVASYDKDNACFQVKAYLDNESKKRILPALDEELKLSISRYFVNSRQGTVGYESARIMRILHHMPKAVNHFIFRKSYELTKEVMKEERYEPSLEEYVHYSDKSVRSYVYTRSFWSDWVMECPICKKKSQHAKYDINTFLEPIKSSFCTVVKQKDLRYIPSINKFEYRCKRCGRKIYFDYGFFYRWYPVRGLGIHTSPNGTSLERVGALYFSTDRIQVRK